MATLWFGGRINQVGLYSLQSALGGKEEVHKQIRFYFTSECWLASIVRTQTGNTHERMLSLLVEIVLTVCPFTPVSTSNFEVLSAQLKLSSNFLYQEL